MRRRSGWLAGGCRTYRRLRVPSEPIGGGVEGDEGIDGEIGLVEEDAEGEAGGADIDGVKDVDDAEAVFGAGVVEIIDAGDIADHVVGEGGFVFQEAHDGGEGIRRGRRFGCRRGSRRP